MPSQWEGFTDAQKAWLAAHPDYVSVGFPRPSACFTQVGTLYPDGMFELCEPMKVVRLVQGPPWARCVGIPAERMKNERPAEPAALPVCDPADRARDPAEEQALCSETTHEKSIEFWPDQRETFLRGPKE